MEEMRFDDVTPKEIPVSIGGVKHTLREPSEAAVTTYRDTAAKCMVQDSSDNKRVTGSVTGANAVLVSLCLFDAEEKLVPVKTIRGWLSRVVNPLFEKAYEMAGLKEEEDEASLVKQQADTEKRLAAIRAGHDAAKNSPSDTTDGSE